MQEKTLNCVLNCARGRQEQCDYRPTYSKWSSLFLSFYGFVKCYPYPLDHSVTQYVFSSRHGQHPRIRCHWNQFRRLTSTVCDRRTF